MGDVRRDGAMERGHGGYNRASLAKTLVRKGRGNRWIFRVPAQTPELETAPGDAAAAPAAGREQVYEFNTLFDIEAKSDNFVCQFQDAFKDLKARFRLLSKLGLAMTREAGAGIEKPLTMPAGYTYLGQLIAHDVSFAAESEASVSDQFIQTSTRENLRDHALKLQTIYGGGPTVFPQGYARPAVEREHFRRDRTHLRLGCLLEDEDRPDPQLKIKDDPDSPPVRRDLPRVACPHLNDTLDLLNLDGSHSEERKISFIKSVIERAHKLCLDKTWSDDKQAFARYLAQHIQHIFDATDVVVADRRNDEHVIIAQLTALFHRFHNCVCDRLLIAKPRSESNKEFDFQKEIFEPAQRIVIHVYCSIIRNDYLKRLLDCRIYRHYCPAGLDDACVQFLCRHEAGKVPVEFSHAAFRFGHAMVRAKYDLSGPAEFSVEQILERSSSMKFELLPADKNWEVKWARFFNAPDCDAVTDAADTELIRSDRIEPYLHFFHEKLVAPVAEFPEDLFRKGLALRDLVRCCSVPMATVDTIIRRMRRHPALKAIVNETTLLSDRKKRRGAIEDWIASSKVEFNDSEAKFLCRTPPLFFFVLLEAHLLHGGSRLGPVGSFIVAEMLCAALSRYRGDNGTGEIRCYGPARPCDKKRDEEELSLVFSAAEPAPRCMLDMVKFVERCEA
jgi:heme peroxidase